MWADTVFWYAQLGCVIVAGWTGFSWFCESWYMVRTVCARNSISKYGQGSWAAVTGSTDGIGLGFARTLAKYGFNIVLISRNPEKLAKTAEEISRLHSVQVRTVVADFSKCTENPSEFFGRIDEETRDLDVSILVNNVGLASLGRFHEIDVNQGIIGLMHVNTWPMVYLSKIFLRRFMNRNQPSGLINISSTGSLTPVPGFAVYSATKSFNHMFTLCINEEVKYTTRTEKLEEIDVLSLQPAYVYSPMTSVLDRNGLYIYPEECAECALRVLGKIPYSNGHWKHYIVSFIFRMFPKFLLHPGMLKAGLKGKQL